MFMQKVLFLVKVKDKWCIAQHFAMTRAYKMYELVNCITYYTEMDETLPYNNQTIFITCAWSYLIRTDLILSKMMLFH